MFKDMRRNKKQLGMEENVEILNRGEYGMLSTMGENGYPYVTPLSYVYHKGAIYFHCAREGHKLENIASNNKVSFCIATDIELLPGEFSTKYKSVIIFGKAKEVFEEEKNEVLMALIEKYSQNFLESGKKYIGNAKDKTKVIRIDIDHITGKGAK